MCACSLLFAVYEVIFSGWEHKHEELLVKKYPHRKSDDSCARVVDTLQTVGLMGLANLVCGYIRIPSNYHNSLSSNDITKVTVIQSVCNVLCIWTKHVLFHKDVFLCMLICVIK